MKKRLLLLILIASVCIATFFIYTAHGMDKHNNIYLEKQERLAELLNINLNEYEKRFPTDYFVELLKEDMTVQEVHELMRGYEKVLRCGDYAEVYFYFSTDERIAYRYLIIFDEGKYIGNEYGGFRAYEGINENSSYIPGYADGCVDGFLDE